MTRQRFTLSDEQPFLPWWQELQQGRTMPGLAGLLAKSTGNALWGRFAMDSRFRGERTVRSKNGTVTARRLAKRPGLPGSHDLAETVAGRVRARLFELMLTAGDSLLSAHTDGAWLAEGGVGVSAATEAGWRLKERARRLDLLDPQVLRYWPRPPQRSEPWFAFSGVEPARQPEEFARLWAERGFAA